MSACRRSTALGQLLHQLTLICMNCPPLLYPPANSPTSTTTLCSFSATVLLLTTFAGLNSTGAPQLARTTSLRARLLLLHGVWLMRRAAAAEKAWLLGAKALTATVLLSCCLRTLGPTQLRRAAAKGWATRDTPRCAEVLHCLAVCMLAVQLKTGLLNKNLCRVQMMHNA